MQLWNYTSSLPKRKKKYNYFSFVQNSDEKLDNGRSQLSCIFLNCCFWEQNANKWLLKLMRWWGLKCFFWASKEKAGLEKRKQIKFNRFSIPKERGNRNWYLDNKEENENETYQENWQRKTPKQKAEDKLNHAANLWIKKKDMFWETGSDSAPPPPISFFQKGSYQDDGRFLKKMFLSIFLQASPPILSPHHSILIQQSDSYLRINMNCCWWILWNGNGVI